MCVFVSIEECEIELGRHRQYHKALRLYFPNEASTLPRDKQAAAQRGLLEPSLAAAAAPTALIYVARNSIVTPGYLIASPSSQLEFE